MRATGQKTAQKMLSITETVRPCPEKEKAVEVLQREWAVLKVSSAYIALINVL